MRRREFIVGLGSATLAWPLAARGQQPAMRVIGFLSPQSAEVDYKDVTVPFLQGLKETGYVEGKNVAVEYRYAENQIDRLPAGRPPLSQKAGRGGPPQYFLPFAASWPSWSSLFLVSRLWHYLP